MKSYTEIEPIPDYDAPATWPIWAAYALGMAIMWPVNLALHTWLGVFGLVPFLVVMARILTLVFLRSRRFNREIDAWDERMQAYYRRPFDQRERRRSGRS